jgi:hypothetical protein
MMLTNDAPAVLHVLLLLLPSSILQQPQYVVAAQVRQKTCVTSFLLVFLHVKHLKIVTAPSNANSTCVLQHRVHARCHHSYLRARQCVDMQLAFAWTLRPV